jgi:3D (Asp-Asp-Asp) domain-containing protein
MKRIADQTARIVSSFPVRFPLFAAAFLVLFACLAVAFGADIRAEDRGEPAAVPQIEIQADGECLTVSAGAATAADALREAGILLGPLDRVEPALNQPVHAGDRIQVSRVEMSVIREEIIEPHEKMVLEDPDLRPGIVVRVREGQDGKVLREVRVWKKDGVETQRGVLSEKRRQKRIDAVEMWGTASLPSRGAAVRRCLIMEATAYDPGPISCGRFADGRTSTGLKAGKGVVAVDPRVIPLGSSLYIEGYGLAVAGDVGGAIKGMRIDLGFDTYREAIRYGRRKVRVYLLD